MSSTPATTTSSGPSSATSSPTAANSAAHSSGGSWLDRAKAAASQAAEATKKAATYVADSSKKTYDELKAPPTHVQCSGCPLQVEVPADLFTWECHEKHKNDRTASVCTTCNAAKPKMTDPSVVCGSCHTSTVVPSSNASKHLKEAASNTKKFVATTAAATKEQVKYLSSAPDTFHCAHCNSLLAVPTGPWACQTCTAENSEDAQKCKSCTQKKSEQKAICGVCRQSTVIPTSNFVDGLKATSRDIAKSGSKAFYDVSGKKYITCNRCGDHIQIDAPAGTGSAAHAPATSAAAAPGATSAPSEGAAAAAPEGEGQHAEKEVTCSSCKNTIRY